MWPVNFRRFKADWLFRKKHFDSASLEDTKLSRCLGLFELTALGIGATLGTGIYMITPTAIQKYAGPAMCLSFLIAGLASILSGLCYAELGARVPRAGSAYVYSYVAIGELWAFVIGWNMLLEHVIASAGVARASVTYFDVLAEGKILDFLRAYMPVNWLFLGEYFDPFAFTMCIAMAVYIIVFGFIHAHPHYWNLSLEEVQKGANITDTSLGVGGFMPYGFSGVMMATSTAFYSFVGFDSIATTGEEVANPRRNIPLSTVLSLLICATVLICASAVFSLDTPYYMLSEQTLLPEVPLGYIIVSVGAILCSVTTLLGGMFALPRIAYSMSEDGLLFAFLGRIHSYFKTPMIATMLFGLITALFAGLFDVAQLVDMLSIGTLMAYSMVAASVLVLRYRHTFIDTAPPEDETGNDDTPILSQQADYGTEGTETPRSKSTSIFLALFDFSASSNPKHATPFTSTVAVVLAGIISVTLFAWAVFTMLQVNLGLSHQWPLYFIGLFGFLSLLLCVRLYRLPQNTRFDTFQIPLSPLLPVMALAVNFYMLVSLHTDTWIRFAVWMTVGFAIYFFYSIWASKEGREGIAEEATGDIQLSENPGGEPAPADADHDEKTEETSEN